MLCASVDAHLLACKICLSKPCLLPSLGNGCKHWHDTQATLLLTSCCICLRLPCSLPSFASPPHRQGLMWHVQELEFTFSPVIMAPLGETHESHQNAKRAENVPPFWPILTGPSPKRKPSTMAKAAKSFDARMQSKHLPFAAAGAEYIIVDGW